MLETVFVRGFCMCSSAQIARPASIHLKPEDLVVLRNSLHFFGTSSVVKVQTQKLTKRCWQLLGLVAVDTELCLSFSRSLKKGDSAAAAEWESVFTGVSTSKFQVFPVCLFVCCFGFFMVCSSKQSTSMFGCCVKCIKCPATQHWW